MLAPELGGGPLLGGVNRHATASLNGGEAAGFVDMGLRQSLGAMTLQPVVGLSWSRLHRGAFAERGADSIALVARGADASSAQASIGLRTTGHTTASPSARIAPYADVRYVHELLDENAPLDVTFADAPGTPFRVSASTLGVSTLHATIGLAAALGHHLIVSGGYHAQFESGTRSHAITLNIAF
jgi:outer membrane autotransporter protein